MKKVLYLATFLAGVVGIFAGDAPLQAPVGLLGVSCGGVHVSTFATGFQTDESGATVGVLGEVHAWTRCSSGGRGSTPRTYSTWVLGSWKMDGSLVGTFPWPDGEPKPISAAGEYSIYGPPETDGAGDTIYTASVATSYGTAYVGHVVSDLLP